MQELGGSLIDPSKIMLKDKLAFLLGAPRSLLRGLCTLPHAEGLPLGTAGSGHGTPRCASAYDCVLRSCTALPAGVVNVCLTSFWIGRWPGSYHWCGPRAAGRSPAPALLPARAVPSGFRTPSLASPLSGAGSGCSRTSCSSRCASSSTARRACTT